MRRTDYIDTAEFTDQELISLMNLALAIKACIRADYYPPFLLNRTVGLLLGDCGSRMSSAFITAMRQLGGRILFLGHAPSVREARRVAEEFSPYVDCFAIRSTRHEEVLALTKYSGLPVVNAGSDLCVPVQELADLITMYEHLPREKRLESAKVVYEGPASPECASLLFLTSKMGMRFVQVASGAEQTHPQAVKLAEKNIKKSGGAFLLTDNAFEGLREANYLRVPRNAEPSAMAKESGAFLIDPWDNYVTALRALFMLLLYRDPASRDTLLAEKARRTLSVKLHDAFGYGEA